MRLGPEWKKKIPKGNLREVQKHINMKLKEVSKTYDYYGKIGFSPKDFEWELSIQKKCALISIFRSFKPPETFNDLKKFVYQIDYYHYKKIKYSLSYQDGKYLLEFPLIEVKFKTKKDFKKRKRKLKHDEIIKKIDELK